MENKKCKYCSKIFSGPTWYIKDRKYCCYSCSGKAKKGIINLKLKGRIIKDIIKEKISKTNKIRMKKIIHHINGNHNDNRPENRMVMSQSEHIKIHIKQGDVHPWD